MHTIRYSLLPAAVIAATLALTTSIAAQNVPSNPAETSSARQERVLAVAIDLEERFQNRMEMLHRLRQLARERDEHRRVEQIDQLIDRAREVHERAMQRHRAQLNGQWRHRLTEHRSADYAASDEADQAALGSGGAETARSAEHRNRRTAGIRRGIGSPGGREHPAAIHDEESARRSLSARRRVVTSHDRKNDLRAMPFAARRVVAHRRSVQPPARSGAGRDTPTRQFRRSEMALRKQDPARRRPAPGGSAAGSPAAAAGMAAGTAADVRRPAPRRRAAPGSFPGAFGLNDDDPAAGVTVANRDALFDRVKEEIEREQRDR